MVLLTTTPAAKSAIHLYNHLSREKPHVPSSEPSLADPALGAPVSHAHLIEVARFLRHQDEHKSDAFRLDALLKGANVYVPPPKPKPEPSAEYTALMARLRKEEENRAYQRMINPPSHLPVSPFSTTDPPSKDQDDEVTYADVNRQLALIINVLVSIIACSVAIWIAARHWSVPQRMALSMSGSAIVAFAEVAIYSGYIRRVREAKQKERLKVETREVVETWVIEKKDAKAESDVVRFRKGKHR